VPGYRGVFITKNGKHFVKINGTRLTDDKTTAGTVLLFDDSDDAARMHDSVAREVSKDEKIEYNFKTDGTRIIYEDINPASTSGLGGSAANVVPALSVINIKVGPNLNDRICELDISFSNDYSVLV
jgi:homoserine kinase